MTVRGILWHSTGANNPNLKRYVQPSDNAPDRAEMLALIGKNPYNNDMNHITRQMGVNAWIGKLADGTVATVQTMPWNYKPWGCGNGKNGSCNDGWIQFEVCEDSLTDETYGRAAYWEACELTAYLCKMFGINPYGTVKFKGQTVPTILCHRDSHALELGNNHGDIYNWFPRFGLNMTTVREDVAKLLGEDEGEKPVEHKTLRKGMEGDEVKALQQQLIALGYDLGKWGADGDFGSATENAVKAFQKDNGLAVDGIVGPSTLEALGNATVPGTYAVTIRNLTKAEADKLAGMYAGAEVKKE